ncbi:MAG TPA: deoxyribose-phosphate aldolase [Solirubrobacteraceae bacterium]|nr:deoxyribose-phosphate aldolase [Solirubrobacteraceae bacterium]
MTDPAVLARRVLPLIDLTSLTGEEDEAQIVALCGQARTPAGDVAAVCVDGRWAAVAARELDGSPVALAVVANFPEGDRDPERARREARQAVADGADEVDVVLPYGAWIAGDEAGALAVVEAARAAAPPPARLKVILETGRLRRPDVIRAAALAAIDAGADFVKTSTGKLQPGATTDAARAMLEAIAERDGAAGFKASGGVRTTAQAGEYLALADELLGPAWAAPGTFRFGASGLLDDVLAALGERAAGTDAGGY